MKHHPIRSIVNCAICGARRRIDCGRVTTVRVPTRYVKDAHTSVLVVDGAVICDSHQTIAEYERDREKYGRTA